MHTSNGGEGGRALNFLPSFLPSFLPFCSFLPFAARCVLCMKRKGKGRKGTKESNGTEHNGTEGEEGGEGGKEGEEEYRRKGSELGTGGRVDERRGLKEATKAGKIMSVE